jgi:4-hydroxybenzoate polyprenyltransferase
VNSFFKLIPPFLRLVRWPNLVFIVVTQVLFYYCITLPVFASYTSLPSLSENSFWLLVIASVFIAAAGYIINDYFDINIDRVNKPDKIVVDKIISRRWAILWHFMLSAGGIVFSFIPAVQLADRNAYGVLFINVLCVGALWFYSTSYKRKLLIGNILISLLTAWTILILYVIDLKSWFFTKVLLAYKQNYELACNKLFKFAILYASFAFIISLIREVIKDMEDMEGDTRYKCKTMPIVWGVPATKVFIAVWTIVLIGALSIVQFYVMRLGWWISALYCFLLIILPLIWILKQLYKAQLSSDYHLLSSMVKFVMLAGILSMFFIKMYTNR